MQKIISLMAVVVALGIGFCVVTGIKVEGLPNIVLGVLQTPGANPEADPEAGSQQLEDRGGASERGHITIASFNIQVFGESKLNKPDAMKILVDVVRRFDVVAIQEVRAKSDDILPRFLALINADGSKYDYAIGPREGRTNSKEQYAFIYDTRTIEIDRPSLYVVGDPDDMLHREPFVGAFRVKGLPPDQAFTFTLIDIHTDPDETDVELNVLDDVYVAVRRDGRGEDDVILLGDLNVDDRHLGELGKLPNMTWTIRGTPTNTRQKAQYDNMVFDQTATTEYTGRSGVFNLIDEYGLSEAQALEVSDHFPIWAEFSVYEGGQLPPLASRNVPRVRQ